MHDFKHGVKQRNGTTKQSCFNLMEKDIEDAFNDFIPNSNSNRLALINLN